MTTESISGHLPNGPNNILTPGIRSDDEPPFHQLDEYLFQKLSRDILGVEPDISTCDVYGVRGQRQYGIDLIAIRTRGDGMEVGQCKCVEKFSLADIQKASDEFLQYWDSHWAKRAVKRFILFVASELSSRQVQDALFDQRNRFGALGIAYEAWSSATITKKLRAYPEIVGYYLHPANYWVEKICGPGAIKAPFSGSVLVRETESYISSLPPMEDGLANYAMGAIEGELERMRELWRQGNENEVKTWVTEVRDNIQVWSALSPELKARILTFQAFIELNTQLDTERVRRLADEARALSPGFDQARLRATIALREGNPGEALSLLQGDKDIDTVNLRAAILLELGQVAAGMDSLTIDEEGDVDVQT